MVMLAWGADATTPAKKTTASKKSTSNSTTAHKTTTTASSKKGTSKKAPVRKATTWRNRQMAPTPERYQEIQSALVSKGYLKPEEAGTGWNQNSVDALKKFQAEQNLDASGKINSLSLIALGLGPKHDTAPTKPAENQ